MSAIEPAKAGDKSGIMAARAEKALRTVITMNDQQIPTTPEIHFEVQGHKRYIIQSTERQGLNVSNSKSALSGCSAPHLERSYKERYMDLHASIEQGPRGYRPSFCRYSRRGLHYCPFRQVLWCQDNSCNVPHWSTALRSSIGPSRKVSTLPTRQRSGDDHLLADGSTDYHGSALRVDMTNDWPRFSPVQFRNRPRILDPRTRRMLLEMMARPPCVQELNGGIVFSLVSRNNGKKTASFVQTCQS